MPLPQQLKFSRKIAEILLRVRHRDGLPTVCSHVEHLVGRVSTSALTKEKGMPGLDLADKTQAILQSGHPVRHVLEREIFNSTKQSVSYYDWLMLFGRGIRKSKNPKYEEMLDFICRGADSGMFSSEIHQTILDIPEDYKPVTVLTKYALGNKYAALVGDYFAIRCIYFIEKAKNSKAFVAITKGLEEFTTANFAVQFLDPKIIYPILPSQRASIEEWIRYNKKISGYFTGGLYAVLVVNYNGLPQDEKVMNGIKRFSSNLAVLLRGISDIEMLENVHEFSSIPSSVLTTLPAVLYQQKHPTVFDSLRHQQFNFNADFKQLVHELEVSSVLPEAKFILGELALETKNSFDEIVSDVFYADIVHDLVDAVTTFD